jgi:hypothetical protein
MALTYVTIASTSLPSQSPSIEFTNIPDTYTDLLVKFSLRSTENGTFTDQGFRLTFNNNGSGYYNWLVYGSGADEGVASNANQAYLRWVYGTGDTATASMFSNGEIYIPNYLWSNNKSISSNSVSENNSATGNILAFTAGYWSNSSAITSIKLETNTGNWVVNSTATLHGIKNTV